MSPLSQIDHEQWRPVPGYEGLYEVSDHGRVRSLDRIVVRSDGTKSPYPGKLFILQVQEKSGYVMTGLSRGGKKRTFDVHRLVASAFLGPCPEGMEVCHNNGDPTDNRAGNLRYGTKHSNFQDTILHGTNNQTRKKHCPRGHLLTAPNLVPACVKRNQREGWACAKARSYLHHYPDRKTDLKRVADSYYKKIMKEVAA